MELSIKHIFFDTLSFWKNRFEETFDKDDEVISRQMSKILANKTDRKNFYSALEQLENNSANNVEVELTNGQELDLIMK